MQSNHSFLSDMSGQNWLGLDDLTADMGEPNGNVEGPSVSARPRAHPWELRRSLNTTITVCSKRRLVMKNRWPVGATASPVI